MHFHDKLKKRWRRQKTFLCVGLDPDPARLPVQFKNQPHPLYNFNIAIINATAVYACAFKPQFAYYAAVGAEDELYLTINYIKSHYPDIPVILDAKRGDIGVTAKMYAIEAFERYQADAVTVNPYMGGDTLHPYLEYQDKGVIILCRTSNPGSGDLQLKESSGLPIFQHVVKLAMSQWNDNGNVSLVVGATHPETIGQVRKMVKEMPLLIPGIGAQGGDLQAVMKNGLTVNNEGLMVNASRSILFASARDDFAEAAANEAKSLVHQMKRFIE